MPPSGARDHPSIARGAFGPTRCRSSAGQLRNLDGEVLSENEEERQDARLDGDEHSAGPSFGLLAGSESSRFGLLLPSVRVSVTEVRSFRLVRLSGRASGVDGGDDLGPVDTSKSSTSSPWNELQAELQTEEVDDVLNISTTTCVTRWYSHGRPKDFFPWAGKFMGVTSGSALFSSKKLTAFFGRIALKTQAKSTKCTTDLTKKL